LAVPQRALPPGFSIRWYAPGDEDTWWQIQEAHPEAWACLLPKFGITTPPAIASTRFLATSAALAP
ncbi:MAG: hypothetical protein PVF45_04205, partial [Anaerolineae bacterium]